jgi:hypothetical protein
MDDQFRNHEKRRSVRLSARCPSVYLRFDKDGEPYDQRPSRTFNVSSEGAGIESSFEVDPGELLKVTLALGEQLVNFKAKVAYVNPKEDGGCQFGVSIQDIEKTDKIALTRFIYYFNPSQPSCG